MCNAEPARRVNTKQTLNEIDGKTTGLYIQTVFLLAGINNGAP